MRFLILKKSNHAQRCVHSEDWTSWQTECRQINFFSAATLAKVDIANYPFCTIEPNVGVAFVAARLPCPCKDLRLRLESEGRLKPVDAEDPRQGSLCEPRTGTCVAHRRLVPCFLVDIAGLVPGASEGKGRGNAFLADLANCDAFNSV